MCPRVNLGNGLTDFNDFAHVNSLLDLPDVPSFLFLIFVFDRARRSIESIARCGNARFRRYLISNRYLMSWKRVVLAGGPRVGLYL